MSRKSTSRTFDDVPIRQADIDAGRLVLRKRAGGRIMPTKQRVNIYLDSAIVEHFKKLAGGRGYQTLINETLRNAVTHADMEATLRKVIREELRGGRKAA